MQMYSLRVLEVSSTKSFYEAKLKVLESLVPSGRAEGKNLFPCLFRHLMATSIAWVCPLLL